MEMFSSVGSVALKGVSAPVRLLAAVRSPGTSYPSPGTSDA
jgi:hypothetical protein